MSLSTDPSRWARFLPPGSHANPDLFFSFSSGSARSAGRESLAATVPSRNVSSAPSWGPSASIANPASSSMLATSSSGAAQPHREPAADEHGLGRRRDGHGARLAEPEQRHGPERGWHPRARRERLRGWHPGRGHRHLDEPGQHLYHAQDPYHRGPAPAPVAPHPGPRAAPLRPAAPPADGAGQGAPALAP